MSDALDENIFGKIRGRFDEAKARQLDRSLPTAAIAALAAMPETEWPVFVEQFNKTFRHGERPRRIIQGAA